ncbi:MAG TPA: peptidylprolyl isomerase, partial [Vicinamibacterales bacterium]|nr:peptidylprolyl isomerase [Vicinamibacterales bacterium]
SRPGLNAGIPAAAAKELQVCYQYVGRTGVDQATQGQILQAIGLIRYEKDEQTRDAEAFLVRNGGSPQKAVMLGAATGLEALYRQHRQYQASDEARVFLRRLATAGVNAGQPAPLDMDARVRRMALTALQAARDQDYATLRAAMGDGDWQMRRLVVLSLNMADPQMAAIADELAADTAFQVRYELLTPLSRVAASTHLCAPIAERLKDPAPLVVMRAMDVLPASCTDLADVLARLAEMAQHLARNDDDGNWQINSRALTALARLNPQIAKPLMAGAVASPIWQVRAAAAAATVGLADEANALTLARDPVPNVQNAALDALSRMKSPAVVTEAIEVLKTGADYQLLRTAAIVLKGLPAQKMEEATAALIFALRRLTDQESDTTRDPRLAILERLGETLNPLGVYDLAAFITDFDDEVNAAARKAFAKLRNPPPQGPVKRRYPYQPPVDQLMSLPSEASIQLESGVVTLSLLKDVAPVTIARFAELARRGHYNGLTFHRVVPNFVVQGGSPGANEYMGASRYMRDEVGPQGIHVRGAVGISTRGGDTGDGQIFIDLIDLPRLDRDYTVFAYVTSGMELVDRILEGAKIVSVSVK